MKAKVGVVEAETTKDDYEAIQAISKVGVFQLLSDEISYFRQTNLIRLSKKFEQKCMKYKLNPRKVAPQFLQRFLDAASYEDNEEMQDIWTDILLRESGEPNATSPRTIETLKNLSHDEAKKFLNICKYAIRIGGSTVICNNRTKNESLEDIVELVDAGLLVSDNSLMSINLSIPSRSKQIVATSFGEKIAVFAKNDSDLQLMLQVPIFTLTRAGQDIYLSNIAKEAATDKFLEMGDFIRKKNPNLDITAHEIISIDNDKNMITTKNEDLLGGLKSDQ